MSELFKEVKRIMSSREELIYERPEDIPMDLDDEDEKNIICVSDDVAVTWRGELSHVYDRKRWQFCTVRTCPVGD